MLITLLITVVFLLYVDNSVDNIVVFWLYVENIVVFWLYVDNIVDNSCVLTVCW